MTKTNCVLAFALSVALMLSACSSNKSEDSTEQFEHVPIEEVETDTSDEEGIVPDISEDVQSESDTDDVWSDYPDLSAKTQEVAVHVTHAYIMGEMDSEGHGNESVLFVDDDRTYAAYMYMEYIEDKDTWRAYYVQGEAEAEESEGNTTKLIIHDEDSAEDANFNIVFAAWGKDDGISVIDNEGHIMNGSEVELEDALKFYDSVIAQK